MEDKPNNIWGPDETPFVVTTVQKPRLVEGNDANRTVAASADLNATWTYNNEGNLTGTAYPGDPNGYPAPPSYSYNYDGMGRLNGMGGSTVVSGVQYNAAGQMTAGLDTRTYNPMGQLTSISSGSLSVTYSYSTTQNIGKISSATYNGEQVSYAYDTLNRLIAAQAGSTWGQGFNYDPFGNLTTKYVLPGTTGSVPTLSVVPDAATNHLGGVDANGNATGYGINYDLENRLITASGAQYTYDGQNKRIFSCTNTCASETYYFYAPSGKLIAQFTPVYTAPYKNQNLQIVPATLAFQNGPTRAYFGSRLLGNEDRLGSRGKYFPYGEDNSSQNPPSDNVKFATYTRDSVTGLDYADQRYYASSTGRFMTPDPYMASGGPGAPQSWNRYAYALDDSVNWNDPEGLKVKDCDWEGGCFNPTATVSYVGGYNVGGLMSTGALWALESQSEQQYNLTLSATIGWSASDSVSWILQYVRSDQAVQASMRSLLLLANADLSPTCSSNLIHSGVNISDISSEASTVQVVSSNDPRLQNIPWSAFNPDAKAGVTVAQYFAALGPAGPPVAVSSASLNMIIVNANEVSGNAMPIIFHELLHLTNPSLFNDTLLANQLHVAGLPSGDNIASFLHQVGCP